MLPTHPDTKPILRALVGSAIPAIAVIVGVIAGLGLSRGIGAAFVALVFAIVLAVSWLMWWLPRVHLAQQITDAYERSGLAAFEVPPVTSDQRVAYNNGLAVAYREFGEELGRITHPDVVEPAFSEWVGQTELMAAACERANEHDKDLAPFERFGELEEQIWKWCSGRRRPR